MIAKTRSNSSGGDFGNVAEGFDAGVGDHDVNVPEVGVGGVEELDDVGGLGNICCDCDGFAAEGFDRLTT